MNCFDGEGEEKEFGKDGYCSYKYGMVELNGEKTYTIERRGHDKRGDVSEYPHKSTKDICKCEKYLNYFGLNLKGVQFVPTQLVMIAMPRAGLESQSW